MALVFSSTLGDVAAAIATLLVLVYAYFSRVFSYWEKRGVHNPRPMSVFGNLGPVVLQRMGLGEFLCGVYEASAGHPIVGLYAFTRPVVMVRDLEVVRAVLVKDAACFLDRCIEAPSGVDPLISKNLFFLKGHSWRHMRVRLTPTFSSGKIKGMFSLIDECAKGLLPCIDHEMSKGNSVLVKDTVARYSTDVIASCAFGVDANALSDPDCEFRSVMKTIFEPKASAKVALTLMAFAPRLAKILRLRRLDGAVECFVRRTFWDVVEHRSGGGVGRNDFVDLLMRLKREVEAGTGKQDDNAGSAISPAMILTVVVGLFLLYVLYSWFNMKPKNFPPGPPCLPLIGSVLSFPSKYVHLHMMEWRKKFGPLVGFMFVSTPVVCVSEPKAVMEILKREEFQMRADTLAIRTRSFNKRLGVFFSDGPFWVEQRRFALRHLRDFGFGKTSEEGMMHDEVIYLIKKLEMSKVHPISGLFNVSFVNLLWVALAGTRLQNDDEKLHKIIVKFFDVARAVDPTGGLINAMPILRFIAPNIGGFKDSIDVSADLSDYIKEVVLEHEKTLSPDSPRDFIDMYLLEKRRQQSTEGSTFTDEGLIVICMDLFGAGVESTGNALSFALMYMVLHPEVQRKVHQELDRVVGRDRLVSLADRNSLPYVEAVIAESTRCNTIAPITPPHRAERDTQLQGYFIPKDTLMLVSIWSLLHDEDHWGDPENFRPERFIGPDGKFVKDDWVATFGMGKRMCLGETLARKSLYLFFTCLMQRFVFSLPPGEPKPSTLSMPGFTVAPQRFNLQVESRV